MAVVFLDITSGDDPLGTILTTFDDSGVGKFEIGCGENELGAISFTIRRDHPDATETNLAAGNYVQVRIPLIQAGAVTGFFLDEHDDTIIARDEEGNEYLTRSGPGSLAILRNALLLNDIHVPAQINRGNRDVPGYWTWVGEPYGAILQRLLEEGRLEPGEPLGDVTDDFTRAVDSDGLAWPDITDTISVPIGTDGLSAYHTLVQSGQLFVRIEPDLFLHAYKTRGLDLTGPSYAADVVRFVKGENILTDLSRQGRGARAATHALVEGSDMTYRQVVDPAYTTGTGRWTKVDYTESDDADLLDDVGLEEIRQRIADQQSIELEFEAGDDPTIGRYLPFKHFNTGDLITLDTGTDPWDYDDSSFRVVGFSIELGEASDDSTDLMEARSLRWTVELGASSSAGGMGGGSGDKCCPSIRLCHDITGGEAVILDSFDGRTETPDDWGTSSSGPVWTVSSSPNVPGIQVTSGRGILATTTSNNAAVTLLSPPAYLLSTNDVTMETEFELTEIHNGNPDEIRFELWNGGATLVLHVSATIGGIQLSDNTVGLLALEPFLDWATSTMYKVKWEQAYDGVGRAKIWRAADPEPGWMVSAVGDVTLVQEYFTVKLIPGDTTNTVLSFDYIAFTAAITDTCIHGGALATSGDSNKAAPGNHQHDYVAAGGTTGQVLAKNSAADWDTEWVNQSGGSPTTADYLVGTAQAGLSAEIVAGATPGGELGGTWASPTVDATHSGSTHDAATNTHIADTSDAHDASAISVLDTGGNFTATEVEGALAELAAGGGAAAHIADTSDAHDASAISIVDTGAFFTGTDVEAALQELGAGGLLTATPETPAGTINGTNDTFTLSTTPANGIILVKNGMIQRVGAGNDYTLATNTITYLAGNIPQTGDSHVAYMLAPAAGGGAALTVSDEGVDTGSDATTIDFVGAGVTATGAGATKTVTIPGGGGTTLDLFGDGQDGSVVVNSGTFSVSVGGSPLITNNVLQRDGYFTTLELNGGDLNTNGFRIFCSVELKRTSGVVKLPGLAGGNGIAGSAGAGGGGGTAASPTTSNSLPAGANGVTGGSGGSNVQVGFTPTAGLSILVGRTQAPGGAAGGDSGGGQAGGQRGATTTANTLGDRSQWTDMFRAQAFRDFANALPVLTRWFGQSQAGGGGGSAAASGGGGGGGSGGSGGPIVVCALLVSGNANIESIGGVGGNGAAGGGANAGGGAGGNGGSGGWIVLIYGTKTGTGTLVVTGGAGGTGAAGVGTGTAGGNGSAGNAGITKEWQV